MVSKELHALPLAVSAGNVASLVQFAARCIAINYEGNIVKMDLCAILEQNVAVVLTMQTLQPKTLHAALVLSV